MNPADHGAPDSAHVAEVRAALDRLDRELFETLGRRRALVSELWAWKQRRGLPRRDPPREAMMLDEAARRGPELGLAPDAARHFQAAVLAVMREAPCSDDEEREPNPENHR